jgi:hypothetical protein
MESLKAQAACNDYLLMGPGRSLKKLHEQYRGQSEGGAGVPKPPTTRLATLEQWSTEFNWQERAAEYDQGIQAEKEEAARAYRAAIMEEGFALDMERVAALKELAAKLQKEIGVPSQVWLKDVKQIGAGDKAERVDIVRFNAPLIDRFRGTLDDIAKEVGGRKQKVEHTGENGGPIQQKVEIYIPDNGRDHPHPTPTGTAGDVSSDIG